MKYENFFSIHLTFNLCFVFLSLSKFPLLHHWLKDKLDKH